ncbi:MmgE/PrpD family protein [Novosphingobium malaysiense]|uniref:MmgE/PrpD family protein n=1 Tax=Novosphingobium malaysiense TaxID=1348853 RepID=A0A0B1ZHY7_9SPHN|nr:MmgE/PrpD family protein [Novosphingobium malaysiense]KHK88967.1 hypothetical protein LK12_23025 [Novosphingobium malaysiense]
MEEALDRVSELGCSAKLVDDVRNITAASASDRVLQRARHAVLDWIGVTISGARQPSALIAQDVMLAEGGPGAAQVIGAPHRMTARQAALCGGIASHSQDFDDMGMRIHPSVVTLPTVFALGDELDLDGMRVLESLLHGFETLRIIAESVTDASYPRGWHCTGTFGVFGAAMAASSLLGLDADRSLQALGIAGTQASGLRSSFGTMGKHLNAGNAAAVGVLSARLCEAGFTGPRDVIESPLGFASAVNPSPDAFDPTRPSVASGERQGVEEIIFKLHAACGGTHSSIDGIRSIRAKRPFSLDEVEVVELVVPELTPGVCGIEDPKTGLEGMFSIKYCAALALADRDTGTDSFTDELVMDPLLVAARGLVQVKPEARLFHMSHPSEVTLRLKNGEVHTARIDIFTPRPDSDLERQWEDLVEKFHALVMPVLGVARSNQLVETIARFETLGSIRELTALTVPAN